MEKPMATESWRIRFLCAALFLASSARSWSQDEPDSEDPRFHLTGAFAPEFHAPFGVRDDTRTFVCIGGGHGDWILGWDLETGEQKYRIHAPQLADRLRQPEMAPSGRYFLQASQDRDTQITTVTYTDSRDGRSDKVAVFGFTVGSVSLPGDSVDERYLCAKYAPGGCFLSRRGVRSCARSGKARSLD